MNTTRAHPFVLPPDVQAVLVVDFLVAAFAFALHVIGIALLLRKQLSKISPQNMLLIHLSLTSIVNVFLNGYAVYVKFVGTSFPRAYIPMYYTAHTLYIGTLALLSLNRFLFVAFPLKYRSRANSIHVTVSVIALWLISATFGLLIAFAGIATAWFYKYASYIYNGALIVLSTLIYAYIVIKVSRSSLQNHPSRKKKKLFMIPFLLVFSFVVFAFLPHLIAYNVRIKDRHTRKLLLLSLIGVNLLNNVSDPVIYVFLQATTMQKLVAVFRYSRDRCLGRASGRHRKFNDYLRKTRSSTVTKLRGSSKNSTQSSDEANHEMHHIKREQANDNSHLAA